MLSCELNELKFTLTGSGTNERYIEFTDTTTQFCPTVTMANMTLLRRKVLGGTEYVELQGEAYDEYVSIENKLCSAIYQERASLFPKINLPEEQFRKIFKGALHVEGTLSFKSAEPNSNCEESGTARVLLRGLKVVPTQLEIDFALSALVNKSRGSGLIDDNSLSSDDESDNEDVPVCLIDQHTPPTLPFDHNEDGVHMECAKMSEGKTAEEEERRNEVHEEQTRSTTDENTDTALPFGNRLELEEVTLDEHAVERMDIELVDSDDESDSNAQDGGELDKVQGELRELTRRFSEIQRLVMDTRIGSDHDESTLELP